MFCTKCGAGNEDDAFFCKKCGNKLIKSEEKNLNVEETNSGANSESDFFFPIDQKSKVKKSKKGRLGCLTIVILFLIALIYAMSNSEALKSDLNTDKAVSAEVSAEDLKAHGLEFDEKAWADYLKLYEAHNHFMSSTDAYSNGRVTKLDFYDYCKKVEKNFGQASISFSYGKTEDEKTYLSTFASLALADQSAAQSLLKYLDSNATKDLSKAKENLDRAKEAATIITSNRLVLLKKIGLSEEELNEKINQAVADVEALDSKQN